MIKEKIVKEKSPYITVTAIGLKCELCNKIVRGTTKNQVDSYMTSHLFTHKL